MWRRKPIYRQKQAEVPKGYGDRQKKCQRVGQEEEKNLDSKKRLNNFLKDRTKL